MNDSIGAAMALNNLGNLAQITRNYSDARRYYQESSTLLKLPTTFMEPQQPYPMKANWLCGRVIMQQPDNSSRKAWNSNGK